MEIRKRGRKGIGNEKGVRMVEEEGKGNKGRKEGGERGDNEG